MKKKRGIALLITALIFVLMRDRMRKHRKLRQQKKKQQKKRNSRSDSVLIPL